MTAAEGSLPPPPDGPAPPAAPRVPRSSARNAALVAAGIFLSRIIGFVRERVFAHYLGNSAAADAFKAALKIPNLLQNLFGEGALSASFIPVYARLMAQGEEEEARRVARVVATVLAVLTTVVVAFGVLATPFLIDLIAPGFEGEKRLATIRMVRILFPGVGLLVLSAWCLGILNSHRKFFLPYAAPVVWNGAMIAALVWFGARSKGYDLAVWISWAAVAGSFLQLAVQLPTALRLAGRFRPEWELTSHGVKTVLSNFLPSVGSRGVNQVSSYIDQILASFLPTGAVAALAYAQTLWFLPVSLFGMSISSAELPEMASGAGTGEEAARALRERLVQALRRVAFFVVPTVAVFAVLGDSLVAFVFQTGKFGRSDVEYVWAVLAGSAVGLLASTLGRLYASTFWALHDTRTPLRFAVVRVLLTTALGWLLAFPVPRALGLDPKWGLPGLTVSAGIAGWLEMALLRRALARRIGHTTLGPHALAHLAIPALGAALVGFGVKLAVGIAHPVAGGTLVLGTFCAVYGAATLALKVPEALALVRKAREKAGRTR